ncbi:hypothetical protein N2152v2_000744 [Parachlorella kessleri]
MASAAADDLDRHGEEQASGHRSEGHGPNPVGHGVHWGALLQRVLATAALAAVTYCTVLAVLDPQRHLQQQLLKIVTSAYISEPDPQHVILEGMVATSPAPTGDLRAKVVVRHLPPGLTADGFRSVVASWVDVANFQSVEGKQRQHWAEIRDLSYN